LQLAGDARESQRLFALAHLLPVGDDALRAKLFRQLNQRDLPELAEKEVDMLLKTGWHTDIAYGNTLSYLARRSLREKKYHEAADYYDRCLVGLMRTHAHFIDPAAYVLIPELIRGCRALGDVAAGKVDDALQEANASLEALPGNTRLASNLVPDLEKLGKKKEADAIYDRVLGAWQERLKDYPESAHAHNTLAWLMNNCRRDLDQALKHATKATELEPNVASYIDVLAEIHFRKGERDVAAGLAKKCIELEPLRVYYRKQQQRFKDQPLDKLPPEDND
jgi:tetratricopeptide (TPR) repeat protein